jgi:hypothetical protein
VEWHRNILPSKRLPGLGIPAKASFLMAGWRAALSQRARRYSCGNLSKKRRVRSASVVDQASCSAVPVLNHSTIDGGSPLK